MTGSGTFQRRIEWKAVSVMMVSLLLVFLASNFGDLRKADAGTITLGGVVKNSNSIPVSYAKVYLESPAPAGGTNPWYTSVTTDSFGQWSKSNLGDGRPWYVHASKNGSERDKWPTTISTTKTDIIITIDLQPTRVVNISVAPDDNFRNAWGTLAESEAWAKISGKQWMYQQNWNVRFAQTYYDETWFSPSDTDCGALKTDAKADTDWNIGVYHNADVQVAITTIDLAGVFGCAEVPGGSGSHPAALVQDNGISNDVSNHEILHLHGFNHHTSQFFCTMNTQDTFLNYNTAQPSYDDLMAINGANSHRLWY